MHFVGQSIVSQSLKTTNLMNGPPKNSGENPWKSVAGNNTWSDDKVSLYYSAFKYPEISSPAFNIPKTADGSDGSIDVAASTKIERNYYWIPVAGNLQIWLDQSNKAYDKYFEPESKYEGTLNQTMTSTNNTWHIHYDYMAGGPKTYVYYFNINYR